MAYMICDLDQGYRPRIDHESIALTVGEWPKIRADLAEARRLITMQSLGFVSWVRSTIQVIERPAKPRITWKATSGARGSALLVVEMIGIIREVVLEYSPFKLLCELATHGVAEGTKMDKVRLLAAIPELEIWISSAPRPDRLANSQLQGRCSTIRLPGQSPPGLRYVRQRMIPRLLPLVRGLMRLPPLLRP